MQRTFTSQTLFDMQVFCVLLLAVSACSGQSIQQFLLADDGLSIIDNILNRIKVRTPPLIPIPDVSLDLVISNSTINGKIGSMRATNGRLRDVNSIQRTTPVNVNATLGNLTLSTVCSFWNLGLEYEVRLEILGTESITQLNITFGQNNFKLLLTVYSDSRTGRCGVDLKEAAFSALQGIEVNGKPLGFFNSITINAAIDRITLSVLSQIHYTSIINLQQVAENEICKYFSTELIPE